MTQHSSAQDMLIFLRATEKDLDKTMEQFSFKTQQKFDMLCNLKMFMIDAKITMSHHQGFVGLVYTTITQGSGRVFGRVQLGSVSPPVCDPRIALNLLV